MFRTILIVGLSAGVGVAVGGLIDDQLGKVIPASVPIPAGPRRVGIQAASTALVYGLIQAVA